MTTTIHQGDCRRMDAIADSSIHCVATSPPYWGLRSYLAKNDPAKTSEIGSEPTPEGYVASMVEVGREVRRVLRVDGTWWLNLGDSFSNGSGAQTFRNQPNANRDGTADTRAPREAIDRDCGLPAKSLLLMPFRVALALQADGWILRAAIPWVKANAMPESMQDRPTTAHETVFLLARSERYYFDADAVRVGNAAGTLEHFERYKDAKIAGPKADALRASGAANHQTASVGIGVNPAGRNIRTSDFHATSLDALSSQLAAYQAHLAHVRASGGLLLTPEGDPSAFLVNPVPSPYKHFAMWPPALVKPMILASTSEAGACGNCGSPFRRVVEERRKQGNSSPSGGFKAEASQIEREAGGIGRLDGGRRSENGSTFNNNPNKRPPPPATIGWEQGCSCPPAPPIPCTVLDPFAGTSTTLRVADDLGRHAVGYELNSAYLPIGAERTAQQGLFANASNAKDPNQ